MKMSLCNTFRLFAVSWAIVLSFIDAPVSTFTISRSGHITKTIHDLNQEDGQYLDVKNDLRKPNNTNSTKGDGLIVNTESYSKHNFITSIQDQTNNSFNTKSLKLKIKNTETNDVVSNATISEYEDQTYLPGQDKYTYVSHNLASAEAKQLSSWKKYSIINRKQNPVPLDSNKTDEMIIDEMGVPRQDSKSADIPSLNQIKNFLFPSGFFKSEVQNDTITSTEVTDKSMRDNIETTNEPTTTEKGSSAAVESKRGGFLDFSLKSLFEDSSEKKDSSQENNTSRPKGRRLSWRFGSRYRGKDDSSAEKDKERSRFRLRNNKDRKTDNNNTKESKEEHSKELESREDSDRTRVRPKNNDDEKNNMQKKYSEGNDNYNSKAINGENREKQIDSKEKSKSDAKNDKKILAEWNEYERIRGKTDNEYFKESKESNDVDKQEQNKKSNNFSRSRNNNKNSKEEISIGNIAELKEKTTTEINIWKSSADEKSQSHFKNNKEISKEESNERRPRINESISKEQNDNSFRLSSKDGEENYKKNNNKNEKHEKSDNKQNYDAGSQSRLRYDKNSKEKNDERRKDKNIKQNENNKSRVTNNSDRTSDELREENYNNDKDHFYSDYEKNTSGTEYKRGPESHTQQYSDIDNDREKSRFEIAKASIEQNQTSVISEENNKQDVNDPQKPITIEYIKQYLSTIDEEDENETKTPTVEDETTTTKTKQIEVPNIVAAKYPSELSDLNSTPETLEPYNIPNLLISLPSPRNRDGIQGYSRFNGIGNMQDKKNREKEETKEDTDIINRKPETNNEVNEDLKKDNNITTHERQNYETEKNQKETEAAIQMNDDTRKEELLKEELISNYEENFGRYKENYRTTTQAIIPIKIYEVNKKLEVKENDTVDEKLIVKPLSFLEKLKTTILYPVSANYKPPKIIEVQPPKSFLRDPDDNSWRNESLSSLGIVFKPKNSSKPFTQVLKNKTETEWNNLTEKTNKNETPDLRERLEKIAEIRKTKRKKTDAFGNIIYNDYEETYSRETTFSKDTESSTSTKPTSTETTVSPITFTSTIATTTDAEQYKISVTKATTEKSKKVFNAAEYYDTSDEDDADYLTLAKIDLKKFTVPIKDSNSYVTPPTWPVTNMRFEDQRYHDRKSTLQYFPPLTTQKNVFKDYENDFHRKMGTFTDAEPPTNVLPVSYTKLTTSVPKTGKQHLFTPNFSSFLDTTLTTKPMEYEAHVPDKPDDKDGYTFVTDDGSFNRAADVIKHYRDFLNAVAKDHEEDKDMEEYRPLTKIPTQAVTMSDVMIDHKIKSKPEMGENYDYENNFRKDVLQRFVHNFNQNSERFKSDLPLLYNNSIIHGSLGPGGDVASSRAYLSRMLTRPSGECDNSTAELSPAYELQYYVPEQEEREEVDLKPVTLPYEYRL